MAHCGLLPCCAPIAALLAGIYLLGLGGCAFPARTPAPHIAPTALTGTSAAHTEIPQNFDVQGFIDAELKAGKTQIIIPPGRYRVTPRNGVHLRLKNLRRVTLIAEGVELVCTETTRALDLEDCVNLTIKGLVIDYDPLPFTQGAITALGDDKRWVEFTLFAGYPDKVGSHIEIFDAQSEQLKSLTHYGWRDIQRLGDRRYRVSKNPDYVFNPVNDREEIGDILIANNDDAPGGWIPHAILSHRCTDLRLEDVTIYSSNCFSFFETECDNSTYLRCRLIPRSTETDPIARAHRRIRSGNVDAFHSKHAKRGPKIIECVAKFQGDDCVNICGDYFFVASSVDDTLRVILHNPAEIKPGSALELVTYTGDRLPDAKLIAITLGGELRADERAFIAAQRMNRDIQAKLLAPDVRMATLTLDRTVNLPIGSVVASTERMGNGFLVQNCDFGFNRSRGILIKASHGKIVGNTIAATWGSAILVAPEWWWLESGSSNDLEIKKNLIRDCQTTAIMVSAQGGNNAIAPSGAHQNITIVENIIRSSPLPVVSISSTSGLRLDGNTFPAVPRNQSAVLLENCTAVVGGDQPR